jgi:hypothetical protein
VPPAASGLIVQGDAKALAVLDLDQDGRPDFLATRNSSAMLAFRNGGFDGGNPLRVVLRGPAGNPNGVGARVVVELRDGAAQAAEVHAGSGYYSQSTAACFFGYPDSNPPVRVRVRWPSGVATAHDVPGRPRTLVLSAPVT